ncbi:MAG: sugar phosphate isomerase/epimerase [Caldilineaceae bacterium]|nr:sugar phosphate isomerase/epimerase [Caldilineaceae bacterium]
MPYPYPLVFSTLGSPGWSLERAAEQAVADGYAGLEVRILDGQVISPHLPAERRTAIRGLMKQHGLVIAGIGASTRFSSPDADDRAKHLADLRAYLALASDLEVPLVRTFGGGPSEGQTMEDVIDLVAASLAEAAPDAERHGVTICLETHDAFCRGQEVAGVLNQVDSPNVKAVWDVHHPFRMGESTEDTWNYIGARLAHVHMKDALRREDGSWELKLMGEGEVPCREILRLLASNGYDGYICAEWEKAWHPEVEEPEIAIPQHAQVLRQWMAEDSAGNG